MTDIQLMAALDGLKIADISDLARYKHAITADEQLGFAYFFPTY